MPYVKKTKRIGLDFVMEPRDVGELNYCFTKLAIRYLRSHGLRYSTINDILGAFDGASKEFYRRVASKYEDEKIKLNGDVYEN